MPYREVQFADGEIYHLILRAIDGKLLFKDLDDHYRGVFSIYEFNNSKPVSIKERRKIRESFKKFTRRRASGDSGILVENDERDKLVDVLAFCFMPNHIHLLLKQTAEHGIYRFMVKLASGYGRYFNEKNQRKGYVFQGRFQSVHIEDDNQLRVVVNYIHANPISLIEPKFKEDGIKNHSAQEVLEFLKTGHRWSSFSDYVGGKNFSSITERSFISNVMGGEKGIADNIMDWILYKKELVAYEDILAKLK